MKGASAFGFIFTAMLCFFLSRGLYLDPNAERAGWVVLFVIGWVLLGAGLMLYFSTGRGN